MKNRAAWMLAVVLAVAVLGGLGLVGIRLKPYWVAKYRGQMANLHGAVLLYAPLANADLHGANLSGALLNDANLWGADMRATNLSRASLRGADLSEVSLGGANLTRSDLR